MKKFIFTLIALLAISPLAHAAHYNSKKRGTDSDRQVQATSQRQIQPFRKMLGERPENRDKTSFLARLTQPAPKLSPRSRTPQNSTRDRKVTGQIQVNSSNQPRGLFQNLGKSFASASPGKMLSGAPANSPLRKLNSTHSVRTTAYTHSESDHLVYGRKTAIGSTLRNSTHHTSAAADWSRFPLGTTFKIVGEPTTYVIEDYGSALVGTNTIDIYRPSRSSMNRWGVRHVEIKILKAGCFDRSRNHLSKVTGYWHTRAMYRDLS